MSYQSQDYETEYHSSIGPRDTFQRSAASRGSSGISGGRVLKIVTEMGASSVSGISPAMGANAASSIIESREREKKEMQDLNDRLGSYIERVRFLEAQNRKLVADLEALRGRWGKDTSSVKELYDGELSEARRLMDETAKNKADVEVQITRLQDELNEMRLRFEDAAHIRGVDKEKLETYQNQLADYETEIQMLRRRFQGLQDEQDRYKRDNDKLGDDLQKARTDLDQESVARIDFQNQVQTLLEEIEFLRRVHDQEAKELQALAAREGTADNRDYFKNELALAIRDIRTEYDAIAQQGKSDMESWYKLKVQEVQTASSRQNMETNFQKDEIKRMRGQLGDSRNKLGDLENRNIMLEKQVQELMYQLDDDQRQYEAALNDRDSQIRKMREECQALMMELQMLMDTKQSLDAEIAIYRKMLEGEESRAGLRSLVEQVVKTHSIQQHEDTDSSRIVKGEQSTRTSFQRSAKGNVTIADVNGDGKFIILENTHRTKDENLGSWRLKRKIDGRRELLFTLPSNFVLKAGRSVKIWAKSQGGSHSPPESLVFDGETSWGTGMNVQTILYNSDGEERATHLQRTQQV
jgi:intermediate filament protein if